MGVEITRWVVGVADHDGTGARRDDLFELLDGRQGKARLDVAGNRDNLGVAQLGESVIVGIIRLRNDDFVARVEAHGEGHLKGFAAACSDDDLVGRHVDAMAVIVVAQRATVAGNTGRVAVFKDAMVVSHIGSRLSQSLQSTARCLDVWLTDVEVIHMNAAFFSGIGEGNQFTDCRLRQFHTFIGNFWHRFLFLYKKPSNLNIRRLLWN